MRSNAKADVSVLVPRDVALKFGVVSASALVSGLTTPAKLSTVSGDLVVDGLTGNLELNAVSGELSVRNHHGRITAHTVSGDLTANGDIPKISVDGVSGNVLLDISGTPDDINVNSVSGDLTVRIPDAVGARYRVNTVSGRVQLDNTIMARGIGQPVTGKTGSLDGSWVDISVNSVSGSVSVLRSEAKQASDAQLSDAQPSDALPSAESSDAQPANAQPGDAQPANAQPSSEATA
jgi:DUF4097 and DUF4098 domain-containing protein YvlB